MRAGFIGAGKVGFTLGKYLAMHGIEISGYYSRTPASAKEAAEFTQSRYYTSIEEITKDSDTLFLTVPFRGYSHPANQKNKIYKICSIASFRMPSVS